MNRLRFRASLRFLLQHRLQCALAIAGIGLGVAIVVAIHATQLAARAAFSDALRGVFGSATHVLVSPTGTIDEQWLAFARRNLPGANPAPVLEGAVDVVIAGRPRRLRLLGIDPVSAAPTGRATGFPVQRLITEPGAVVINRATAQALGSRRGDVLETVSGHTLGILAVVEADGQAAAPIGDMLLADIATAQETLERNGELTRIEFSVIDESSLDALRERLPNGLEIVSHGSNLASARALTRAFFTNLDALSLLALLVGGFMVFNTTSFLCQQRQTLFARLRALGVTRGGLLTQLGAEAVALGVIGGVLGSLGGIALARALAAPMSRTLADHYHGSGVADIVLTPQLFTAALVLAVITTVMAALYPLWRASRLPPVPAMSVQVQAQLGRVTRRWCRFASALACAAGLALLAFSDTALFAGFAALALLLIATMLIAPTVFEAMLRVLGPLFARRAALPERLALSGASRDLDQLGPAVTALMAATATSIGVALMVSSFRIAVDDWLAHLLRAELYVSSVGGNPASRIDPEFMQTLAEAPGVDGLSRVRRLRTRTADGRALRVTAYDLPHAARAGFQFTAIETSAWSRWSRGEAVFVSEPLAWHLGLRTGDEVAFDTPGGRRNMPVMGIYRDYGNEQGTVAIAWGVYHDGWRAEDADGVGIYPVDGHTSAALRSRLETLVTTRPGLVIWSNAELRAESMRVFDRTFVITDVLTLIAVSVAALGMFNALLALHSSQARRQAMLRALGLSPGQLRRMLYMQTLVVAVTAILLALPVGAGIAALLIEVINVRSFGWSMDLAWAWASLAGPAAMALLAALAATLYPSEHAVRKVPASALRYE